MDKSKKVKRVNFSVEKIRPITRKNRITGTQDDSDSDSDSDSNIGSDYEKPFSPPPSPFPYDSNNDSPIKPSSALLEKKVFDSALRQIEKEIYHPIMKTAEIEQLIEHTITYSNFKKSTFKKSLAKPLNLFLI